MVKSMLEIITSMLEMLSPMSKILVPTLWLCFVAYAAWYYTSAKKYAPLTREEVRILWKLHKQDVGCEAKKWQEIRRKDKIVGFECECQCRMSVRCLLCSIRCTPLMSQNNSFLFQRLCCGTCRFSRQILLAQGFCKCLHSGCFYVRGDS